MDINPYKKMAGIKMEVIISRVVLLHTRRTLISDDYNRPFGCATCKWQMIEKIPGTRAVATRTWGKTGGGKKQK